MYPVQVLAQFAASFASERLSAELGHSAKRAVTDWYASVFLGWVMPAVQALERVLVDDLDRGSAKRVSGRPATVRAAA